MIVRLMRRAAIATLGALCLFAAEHAIAQEWAPSRVVRIIVPIVGSTNDVLARLVAPELSKAIGQPVIVENKPGAGGTVGADLVAKSPPDGHTLLIGYNGPIAVNVTLLKNIPYDPLKDLAPITLAVSVPQFLVVPFDLPVKDAKDLVARAKAQPGAMSYGSVSVGSASHLTMEMMKAAAGVDIVHVPYRGAPPAVGDLVSGRIQAAFFVPGNVLEFMKDNKLKAIATTGKRRFAVAPDVPTMIEQGFPDFEAVSWIGFLTVGGTPKPVIDRYFKEIVTILKSPDIRARLEQIQFDVVASTPVEFTQWIEKEIPRWGTVVKATGATAD
jgi:tripartite-type tricarboxylate transporter receptor subunit TctC